LGIDDSGDNNVGNDGNKGDNDGGGNDNGDVHTDNHGRNMVDVGFEFVQVPDSLRRSLLPVELIHTS
jgi:hypothetical protein